MDSSPYGQNWGGELLLAALRVPGGRYGWKTAHASRIVACCPSGLREQHLTCLKEKAAAANMNVGEPSSEEGLLPRAWPRWELQRCEGWPWRVESEGASCWPPSGGGPLGGALQRSPRRSHAGRSAWGPCWWLTRAQSASPTRCLQGHRSEGQGSYHTGGTMFGAAPGRQVRGASESAATPPPSGRLLLPRRWWVGARCGHSHTSPSAWLCRKRMVSLGKLAVPKPVQLPSQK